MEGEGHVHQPELAACGTCGLIQVARAEQRGDAIVCCRCGSIIRWDRPSSRWQTGLLAVAALVLYLPAMFYPLGSIEYKGNYNTVSVVEIVHRLFLKGDFLIAGFVLGTVLVAPAVQILGWCSMTFLLSRRSWWRLAHVPLRWIRAASPWNMFSIFLLALLIGIVKFGEVAKVTAGSGALALAMVVALCKAAEVLFEPSEQWQKEGDGLT